MELLLDTHTFIWSITNPKLLPEKSRALISNSDNKCYISMASLWEIGIKSSLGRMELGKELNQLFAVINETGFDILDIKQKHILKLPGLPFHHRDPFDRMIIAQAQYEQIAIITKDDFFKSYDVKTIWK